MDILGYSTAVHSPSWTVRLRSFLTEFSDIFSDVGRHIAPTYRHDRCERSVQMRLYALNKRQFVLVFVAFFVCFGLTILIGLGGPPVIETTTVNATELTPKPSDLNSLCMPLLLQTGPFVLKSPPVSTFHQQLWLMADIQTDYAKSKRFTFPFHVEVQVRGMLEEDQSEKVFEGGAHNRTRNLQCTSETCGQLILLHLGFLDYANYVVTVHFYGLEGMNQRITSIRFLFKSYNPSFTQLEIWFRFVFLVLTFISTCLFAHTLRKFSMRDWSMEQRWMSVLLPLLLLYNNPIFPLTFLVNSWIPGMFDAIFQASFLGALLLFWLCLYHGVRVNKRRFTTFYLPKILLVGLVWFAAITLSSWQEFNELRDPTYNYRLDTGNFLGFKIFFFVCGSLYVLYLVYLLIRAYAELRSMPYFDLRLKFLTLLMVIVLSISITILILRFGKSVLEDNFVAQLSTHYQNSVEFMAFYGLLNFYLYTMAFVYSPSKNAVFESHFKDNPALSMLNDSDDEVVYG
ncbi:hypothetical protein CAPTEDRAFT_100629 [Capitella teleta]|uniref:Transmembrane protein 181 n=1 Tax=Capitella teleta TaxID=283909 RepID=R7U1X4_CAPTE|nr:hypothetical protein CAPTEDRAFT_100629 [Capitella teleta]|eukprot:ELU00224.1 hypothetical protein CAPTEDRAFT_100629 [Capitella teleta]